MFYKKRIKWACKFGKMEHKAGRLLGVLITIDMLIAILMDFFKIRIILIISLIATFLCWLTYLISHTIEKKLYPKKFRF